jgi:anaerobic selenocysteine-containing dehydrogenase
MSVTTAKSYCRFCHAYCAIEVDVDDGRVVAVRGDTSDPIYGGYTCIKGRQLPDRHNGPERIRRSLKRGPDGTFHEIPTARAMDEIAERVQAIIREHGPRAVASYCGSYAFQNSAALAVSRAWHKGISSPSFYTSVTIDQPAKFIAPARVGVWMGGLHGFEDADVALVLGNNAIISHFSPFGGLPPFNPVKRLNEAKKRGLRLIVVDPRVTDMARRADLHLQARPGEDPTLLAAMLHVILQDELHDRDFCAHHVEGLETLKWAVRDFTAEYAAERAGLAAADIVAAAHMFAQGPRGVATTGTGPNMAPRANLTEHLVLCLNIICGRFNRQGERVPNPGILAMPFPRRAQVIPGGEPWKRGAQARVRGLGRIIGEMPTAALADEILTPGEGQVRALFSMGGNPAVAWPNQRKVMQALDALELSVSVDAEMSATAKCADYIIAPTLSLERADVTLLADSWYETPYAHYTQAVATPSEECLEEWEFYWELSHRLGTPIALPGGELDLEERPSKHEVLERCLPGTRIPLEELRAAGEGRIYDDIFEIVAPPETHATANLRLDPEGITEELRAVRAEAVTTGAGYGSDRELFTHRLISRRLRHVYNSSGHTLPGLRAKGTTNPAFMNPNDLEALGLQSGEIIEIKSSHASILGVATAAPDVREGAISMAHAWGDPSADPMEIRDIGSSTNALVDDETGYCPVTGMSRQSAIPVNVCRARLPAPGG